MKTINSGERLNVVCPECNKTIYLDPDDKGENGKELTPCKHLKLWHNNICGELVFVHRSLKKEVKESKMEDEKAFGHLAKKHKMTTFKFKGDYIGGCQYPVDKIAFQA